MGAAASVRPTSAAFSASVLITSGGSLNLAEVAFFDVQITVYLFGN